MNSEDGSSNGPCPCRFLVILFNTLEYDGRAQRMIEVLSGFGQITLVDIRTSGDIPRAVVDGIDRVVVQLPSAAGKIERHLRLYWTALNLCRRIKPDVVVAEDSFTTMPSWLLAKLSSASLIYDAHELIIPESGKRLSLRDRLWYFFERWVVPRADLVVTANQERARLMAEHYHLSYMPEFMRNIPSQPPNNSGEKRLFTAYPALMKHSVDERLILYQGYMALSRGIGRFVESIAHLPARFRLVLAGGGPDREEIGVLANRLGLSERVIQLGRIPNRDLPFITQACDIGIVAYPFSGLNNIYCSPNKVFEYAQAGLPMIATNQPPLKAMVERYQLGRCLGPDLSPVEIADAITAITSRTRASYQTALKRFLDDHCWENEAERLRSSIKRLLLRRNSQ